MGVDDAERRLDRILKVLLGDLSLSAIYAALRRGQIRVNGKKTTADYRVILGDEIEIAIALCPSAMADRTIALENDAITGSLDDLILLRTPDLLFLNKPRGIATHGRGSLDDLVKGSRLYDASTSLSFVPGPLHRLDRNTSGILTFSLSMRGAQQFSASLREGKIRKSYLALLQGRLEESARWEDRLIRDEASLTTRPSEEGDLAICQAEPLVSSKSACLALVILETGKTHQIRAQSAIHGHPLLGDTKYGGKRKEGGYFLHAIRLELLGLDLTGLPSSLIAPIPGLGRGILEKEFGLKAIRGIIESLTEASRP